MRITFGRARYSPFAGEPTVARATAVDFEWPGVGASVTSGSPANGSEFTGRVLATASLGSIAVATTLTPRASASSNQIGAELLLGVVFIAFRPHSLNRQREP